MKTITMKRTLAWMLTLCMVLALIPAMSLTAQAAAPVGYTESPEGKVAYKDLGWEVYDVQGYTSRWLTTTFSNGGYTPHVKTVNGTNATSDFGNATISAVPSFANEGSFVKLTYTVTADAAISAGEARFGVTADFEFDGVDSCPVAFIKDSGGAPIGILLDDDGIFASGTQMAVYFNQTPGANAWIGSYFDTEYGQGNDSNIGSGINSTGTPNYTLNGIDSAMIVSWALPAMSQGDEAEFILLIGAGDASDMQSGGAPAADTYEPMTLTGFNADVVAEALPFSGATTAAFDADITSYANYCLYSEAYAAAYDGANAPVNATGGLPDDGVITSTNVDLDDGLSYQLAAYDGDNALKLTQGTATGTLSLASPDAYSVISILGAGASGNSKMNVTIHFEDNSTQEKTFQCNDWFNGSNAVIETLGRTARVVEASGAAAGIVAGVPLNHSNVMGDVGPNLYEYRIEGIEFKNITSIDFEQTGGTAHTTTVLMAVSGVIPGTYAVTVNGGTGSGNYAVGGSVTITADAAPSGKVFDKWTTSSSGVSFANESSATTTFTMPAGAVTVTATYKNKSSAIIPTTPGSSSTPSTPAPSPSDAVIIVDGKEVNAGEVKTSGDITTVTVNQKTMQQQLETATTNVTVIVPAETGTAVAQLVVQNLDDMAAKDISLTIQAGNVQYELPTTAVSTSSILAALGADNAADIQVSVSITTDMSEAAQAAVESAIALSGGELVIPPVEFKITATYEGETMEIDTFSQYVSRSIEITAEQAAKITTAIVIEADGTTRHVPTRVYQQNGKWYAEVSSLTNSTYALIYNELTFADATGKWYEDAVNEMGSRKVISGIGDDMFAGERDITRAEFAAILVRALGLPSTGNGSVFSDVSSSAWYNGAVGTAYEYGLVSGIGNNQFAPELKITRQEAMLMIQRMANISGFTGSSGNIGNFTDSDSVSDWALDAAKWNVGSGLIVGSGGELNPENNITRAETATLVLKLMQKAELFDVRTLF